MAQQSAHSRPFFFLARALLCSSRGSPAPLCSLFFVLPPKRSALRLTIIVRLPLRRLATSGRGGILTVHLPGPPRLQHCITTK